MPREGRSFCPAQMSDDWQSLAAFCSHFFDAVFTEFLQHFLHRQQQPDNNNNKSTASASCAMLQLLLLLL